MTGGWYAERGRSATPATVPVAAGGNGGSRVAELERLARLHDSGGLTDAEFTAEQAAVRNGA